jgi:hypothetical protein
LDNRLGFSFRICFRSCNCSGKLVSIDKISCKLRYTFHNPSCMVLGTQNQELILPSILIICLLSVINERHKRICILK